MSCEELLQSNIKWHLPTCVRVKYDPTRQSVAVQRDGASRLPQSTNYNTPGMHFGVIFTQKMATTW